MVGDQAMDKPTRILLQTTIPFTENDWHIGRFSCLRDQLRGELKATVVEMEGAAVAQVCARFGVPLIVIRSVTDRAEGQAMPSYQRFVDLASRNAADLAVATVLEWQKP